MSAYLIVGALCCVAEILGPPPDGPLLIAVDARPTLTTTGYATASSFDNVVDKCRTYYLLF